jgi:cytochrome c biogenesis protein CcmG, thiol:disulfide interchange protein DsbE
VRRSRLVVLLLVVAAVGAACGGHSTQSTRTVGGGPAVTQDASTTKLIKAANLAPCPTSSSHAVSHGLPDITLRCVGNGPAVNLAGLTGEPSVVNVWASWCTQCFPEFPYLVDLSKQLAGKVRFLGVDTGDTDGGALSFAAALKPAMHYPSVSDPNHEVIDGLAVAPGPPETAFVNSAGTVVHVHPGAYSSLAALRRDLATYLHVGS